MSKSGEPSYPDLNARLVRDADRVRRHTSPEVNRRIEERIHKSVQDCAKRGLGAVNCRLLELDREWDIERILETNASIAAFTGLLLGIFKRRRFFLIPGLVLPFLFQHAVSGWAPPIPILRWLGARTQREIEKERYQLLALRSEFSQNPDQCGFLKGDETSHR